MPLKNSDKELFKEIEDLLIGIKSDLIDYLPPVPQTTRDRLLRLFDTWRQVNLRRAIDLTEAANQMFLQNQIVPGCTLTRAVFETMAIQYFVYEKMLEFTKKSDPQSIHNILLSAVFGKKDSSWPEQPIHVLKAIDKIDKKFKGCRAEYDHLCEFAHPNLHGGFGIYARQEGDKLETYFGKNPQDFDLDTWGLRSLKCTLELITTFNKCISDFLPKFVSMAKKHAPNTPL